MLGKLGFSLPARERATFAVLAIEQGVNQNPLL
jgi:hypothetical protein